jgi:adenine deaminase
MPRKPPAKPAKPSLPADRIGVSLSGRGGTLLLRGGRVLNVFSGEVYAANVLVLGNEIISVGEDYSDAGRMLDCSGKIIVPGFIDGHIHVESSMLHPAEFARLVVQHGTTAVVADPHEIANVLGARGIEFMLKATEALPLDVFLMVPSCVPATNMESSGASVGPKEVSKLLGLPRVLGLAEFMNFPGVIGSAPDALAKIKAALQAGKVVDGHAPGLRGGALQAYVAAGIGSDHECTTQQEAREKLRAGMRIMIREGSAARNMAALLPIVGPASSRRCFFVTDDKHPGDLMNEGHLDATLREAVSLGVDSITAVQMATLNAAEYFGLKNRGAISPGFIADLVVVGNLEEFRVQHVVKSGVPVVIDGKIVERLKPYQDKAVLKSMSPAAFSVKDFAIPVAGTNVKIIRVVPDQIVTVNWIAEPKVEKRMVVADIERDILKLAVIERHHKTGNIGLGLVAGFGIKKGALASSVAHDSHNIIVAGTNDKDMFVAAHRLVKIGGGFVAAAGGKVVAEVALPIAGLMSPAPAEEVIAAVAKILKVTHNWGARLPNPFATLSFLALPVIPELKLTDKGLVDVNRFKVVSLWGE